MVIFLVLLFRFFFPSYFGKKVYVIMIIRKQLFFVLLTLSPSISFKVASELFLRFFSSTRFDRGVARGGGVLGCR